MKLFTWIAGAMTILSQTIGVSALAVREYQYQKRASASSSDYSRAFNIYIRPVSLTGAQHYLDPLYLSQNKNASEAFGYHGTTLSPAVFTLKAGILYTQYSPSSGTLGTWSNETPQSGHLLTFVQSTLGEGTGLSAPSGSAAAGNQIRFNGPSGLALLSVGDDEYAFWFCSNKDKSQVGLSIGKYSSKGVKCINVYAEATVASNSLIGGLTGSIYR